jgi:predicted nucleic acid-binding protein
MKIFVDSSILVEYIKDSRPDLLEKLISSNHYLYTNGIVFSEFMFYYLAVIGEKSPLAVKESKKIKSIMEKHDPIDLFSYFITLPIDNEILLLSYEFMKKYNLLPNDALILATTKLSGIESIATFDNNDFDIPCISESINIINSVMDIK